eukprot:1139835-Pelagomonas_calceolata.AAC.3
MEQALTHKLQFAMTAVCRARQQLEGAGLRWLNKAELSPAIPTGTCCQDGKVARERSSWPQACKTVARERLPWPPKEGCNMKFIVAGVADRGRQK